MLNTNPIINANAVGFTYNDEFEALKALNLDIKDGEFVAVLGPNGSGKSTFAKLVNALLIPSEGELDVLGYDTKNMENTWNIRQNAGMLFQNPDNQIVATIVEDDVAFGPENLGVPPAEIRERVDWALEVVGMSEYALHSPHFLSGGQKQRVSIAGVLAMKPKIIILDEPTAMLDPIGRREVLAQALKLNKEEGITILLITHYMEEAAAADRVVVLHNGSVALQGTPLEVFSKSDELKNLGLDVPQVTEIGARLAGLGLDLGPGILTVEEMAEEFRGRLPLRPLGRGSGYIRSAEAQSAAATECRREIAQDKITIKSLNFTYSKGAVFEKKALNDINLAIKTGEFVGLIGATGSGKSTLIQQLNALLKPESGEVLLDDFNIHSDRSMLKEVRRRVGLVFQYPEHQLFETTIAEDVAFGPKNLGLPKEEVDERTLNALELVGLSQETAEKSPFDLSGGQKRRAAIAGVLAMRPEVLILDEPAAGLDPGGRDEILMKIKEMHEKTGMTTILVSHSMEDIAKLVQRVIVINNGEIVMDDIPARIFARSAELEEMGLSAPQAAILADKLRNIGFEMSIEAYTIETVVDEIIKNIKA